MRSLRYLNMLAAVAVLLLAGEAQAQRPLQQVLDLNRQAMEHYNMLEIPEAEQKLQQALQLAQRGGVSGAPLARTYLNLGVVYVGGMGDNASGMRYFTQALETDPNIQLDPLTSTPEIQTVFNLARQRAGGGGGGGGGPPLGGGGGGGTPSGGGGPVAGNIPHVPVGEQLGQTPVPVFVEVPDDAPVDSIYIHYKGLGMPAFQRAEMQRMAGGFGYEIPCEAVFQPEVTYYLEAMNADGQRLGTAGTEAQPVTVPIVSSRTQPAPSLPGQPPPQTCGESECPPGMPGCNGGGGDGGMGDTCLSTAECRSGLVCEDNFCVAGDGQEEEEEDEPAGDMPRLFVHLGGTLGLAYVTSGSLADGAPPEDQVPNMNDMYEPPWDSYLPGSHPDCNQNEGDHCVRVETPGFVPTIALRLTAGYYLTERIAAAVSLRFQPSAGTGTLSNMLIGLRGQYLLTTPSATGFNLAAFLGTSFGQIQPQPPQNESEEPYLRAGLNGIQLGTVVGYRFARNFGIHVTPEFHALLPVFLMNIDITAGVEVAF